MRSFSCFLNLTLPVLCGSSLTWLSFRVWTGCIENARLLLSLQISNNAFQSLDHSRLVVTREIHSRKCMFVGVGCWQESTSQVCWSNTCRVRTQATQGTVRKNLPSPHSPPLCGLLLVRLPGWSQGVREETVHRLGKGGVAEVSVRCPAWGENYPHILSLHVLFRSVPLTW